ncbi:MAG: glutamate-1-semialdehyde 2,1-aminomutase [Thermoplasmata archaeon]
MSAGWDPVEEFKARTRRSADRFAEAQKHLPGGVTGNVKFYAPYPVYAKRAKGSHLWDLDGNEYVDYMLCFGPLILGHAHPRVVEAVRRQLEHDGSQTFGAPHELELRMAERLKRIFPFADLVRFTNSGLEATMHALRVAKGYRRKGKIAKFEGAYHGSYDEVLVSLAPPVDSAGPDSAPLSVPGSLGTAEAILRNVLVLPYNDIENTERLLRAHKDELAAVIMEPVQRGFVVPEVEFLRTVREITSELGIVLVFDEVMSGFRMDRMGGACTTYGVEPDMITLGKIMGGGFPCGAFMGRREIMDVVNPVTRPKNERVFHGGTFNGHPTVLAAGMATLDVLEEPGTYPALNRMTDKLRDGLNDLFQRHGFDAYAVGPYSTFNIVFTKGRICDYRDAARCDAKLRQQFDYGMLARGIHYHPDKPLYTCTEHSSADVERTLAVADEVLRKMK